MERAGKKVLSTAKETRLVFVGGKRGALIHQLWPLHCSNVCTQHSQIQSLAISIPEGLTSKAEGLYCE